MGHDRSTAVEVAAPPSYVPFAAGGWTASIHARFEAVVARQPNRIAVYTPHRSWSYDELNRAANAIAWSLVDGGIRPGDRVAHMARQSPVAAAAVLGISKAGGVWVPLDVTSPVERSMTLLEDCDATVVAAADTELEQAEGLARAGCRLLPLQADLATAAEAAPEVSVSKDSSFAIVYSSGTTGVAKGIVHAHGQRLAQLASFIDRMRVSPEDRVSFLHSMSSSAGGHDILTTLLAGATLCPFDARQLGFDDLPAWLRRAGITLLHWVPTGFRQCVRRLGPRDVLERVRLVVLGGEPALREDLEAFLEHFPSGCQFVNRLGATEAGSFAYYVADHATNAEYPVLPVGYPPGGWEVFLRDEAGSEPPPGEAGEILVRSAWLSPGYWRNEAMTRASFDSVTGCEERVFRTGDVGRFLQDGSLLYLGRKGRNEKIRGTFVSPAEIEAALRRIRGVAGAAVRVVEESTGEKCLVGYVVKAKDHGTPPNVSQIRRALGRSLDRLAVPTVFVFLERLPETHTGKLDRSALPLPAPERPELELPYAAPETPIEERLAAIWSEVLGLAPVGREDDFLDLGGDSLNAARILSRVGEEFAVRLPLSALFESCTVRTLAYQILHELSLNTVGDLFGRFLDETAYE